VRCLPRRPASDRDGPDDRRKDRNAGCGSNLQGAQQAPAETFGPAEAIEDEDVDPSLHDVLDLSRGVGEASRVKPAAFRPATQIL